MVDDIIFSEKGNCGLITLNRPNSLNAVTSDMVRSLSSRLSVWQSSSKIQYVLVKSSGGRAFSAGGDIRYLYDSRGVGIRAKPSSRVGAWSKSDLFFAREYALNLRISNFGKPYISLVDGIVMGGGVGVSFHGSHIIASDHLSFSMPETGIGFFPDIGSSYFLSRLPDYFGLYLGLTGAKLSGAECVDVGLATHFCSSADLVALERSLLRSKSSDPDRIISSHCRQHDSDSGINHKHRSYVSSTFDKSSVQDIFTSLEAMSNDRGSNGKLSTKSKWAVDTLSALRMKSPSSLELTFRLLHFARELSLKDCLKMEYRLTYRLLRGNEFYEGIRAAVIDKDHSPNWSPSSLSKIDSSLIDSYFDNLETEELPL